LQQYEEWKKGLPDTDWIKDLVPDIELDKFRSSLMKFSEGIKGKANEIDLGMLKLAARWLQEKDGRMKCRVSCHLKLGRSGSTRQMGHFIRPSSFFS
jgi:hypothetical protein